MEQSTNPKTAPDRNALWFTYLTAFLSTVGIGIITPVVPFLVQPYLTNPNDLAFVIGILLSAYSICQFLAAPVLGALSDRYGRRPLLLFCLFGSVVGYLLFGIGGALWVLFLGRILDGITGGNFGILSAYIADVTPPDERGQYFGRIGAIAGIGFLVGPIVGGAASQFGYAMPLYVGAAVTALNLVYGFFFMPESLTPELRAHDLPLEKINPLIQLRDIFQIRNLRWLLIATFLFTIPFAALQTNIPVLAKDALNWTPALIGTLYFVLGAEDIITQGVLLQRLLPKFGETAVALMGLTLEIVGYLCLALSALFASPIFLFLGIISFGAGDALIGPALGGLISRTVTATEQGRVQGGNQSVQALARIIGPLLGGVLYASVGRASPFLLGMVMVLLAIGALLRSPAVAKVVTEPA